MPQERCEGSGEKHPTGPQGVGFLYSPKFPFHLTSFFLLSSCTDLSLDQRQTAGRRLS